MCATDIVEHESGELPAVVLEGGIAEPPTAAIAERPAAAPGQPVALTTLAFLALLDLTMPGCGRWPPVFCI